MRLALAVALLMLCAVARGQDDEGGGLLETPPLGGIPERMEALEREWAEDVGTKDPVDEAAAEAEAEPAEVEEDGLAVEDGDEEPAPVRAPEPPPAKPARPSALPPPTGKAAAGASTPPATVAPED